MCKNTQAPEVITIPMLQNIINKNVKLMDKLGGKVDQLLAENEKWKAEKRYLLVNLGKQDAKIAELEEREKDVQDFFEKVVDFECLEMDMTTFVEAGVDCSLMVELPPDPEDECEEAQACREDGMSFYYFTWSDYAKKMATTKKPAPLG